MKRRKKDAGKASEVLGQAENEIEVSIKEYGAEKTAWDLHQVLTIQRSDTKAYLNGLQSLRALLDLFLQSKEDVGRTRSIVVIDCFLRLLDENVADTGDDNSFSQILQSLHASFRTNSDNLLVSVLSTIVLLLRAFDSATQFHKYGLQLCNALLRKQEARLLSTCMASFKNKTQVISLATQILTELVSFDAGAVAWALFAQRNYLLDFRILSRNLRIRDTQALNLILNIDNESVRLKTCLYLIANFKYQYPSAKADILKQRDLMQALFDGVANDPIDIVNNTLSDMKTCIVFDASIPHSSKGAIWTPRILRNITDILRSDRIEFELAKQNKDNQSLALDLLLLICTTPEAGLLVSDTNWHLPEVKLYQEVDDLYQKPLQLIEVELYSLDRHIDPMRIIAIKNRVLGEFILHLKPFTKANERRILVEAFKAAPELAAYYFYRKPNSPHEPKLSHEWLGFFSFIHSTIKLPPCQFAEDWPPPPTYISIESIIPLPLTQRILRRGLNHKSPFIRFLSSQSLLSALRKLKVVREKYMDFRNSRFGTVWKKAANQLAVAFAQRCPDMGEVIKKFKSTSPSSTLQYETASALVELYFEVIPQVAVKEHFDMSIYMSNALQYNTCERYLQRKLSSIKLCRLVNIARYSSSVRWFSKSESMNISPFSTLLVYLLNSKEQQNASAMMQLLNIILREHDIFQRVTTPTTFDAVKASLSYLESHTLASVMEFFDECCVRCARKPLKYHDDLDEIILVSGVEKRKPSSAYWAAVVEQWSFAQSSIQYDLKILAGWISACLALCCHVGEDEQVLFAIKENIIRSTSDIESKKKLQANIAFRLTDFFENWLEHPQQESKSTSSGSQIGRQSEAPSFTNPYFSPIPPEDDNYPGLHLHMQEDIEQIVFNGAIGDVILCLCARPMGIRKEALVNLRKLQHKLKNSAYSENLQIWLVLSELGETAEQIVPFKPLPHVIGSFAKAAVLVLANPTHYLYSKINKFLNMAPSWRLTQFISYWVDQILLNAPETGDSYYGEVEWLLSIIFDGLKSQEDLDLLRKHDSLEHILAIFNSPTITEKMEKLILGLIWRIAMIGGSFILIIRNGVVSWIKSQMAIKNRHFHDLTLLAAKLEETCDDARIHEWNHGAYSGCLAELRRIRDQN